MPRKNDFLEVAKLLGMEDNLRRLGKFFDILGRREDHILDTYTVATLPDATTNTRRIIYVSNEAGGAQPAFSDGASWRRFTDRAIVS